MRQLLSAFLLLPLLNAHLTGDDLLGKNGWPSATRIIKIKSSSDGSQQPAVSFVAKGDQPRPLLVGLHTWSGDYLQGGGETVYARWCQQQNWHFVHPNFRGPNRTTEALGSDLAVRDILDSVKHMQSSCKVDNDRIYLIGVSGGGHAALLMAGRAPELWAGVSAWCPISDVDEWWKFHAFKNRKYDPGKYAKDIEKAVGGRPDKNKERLLDCEKRSPLKYLAKAYQVNLDINHGIFDGRKGSVPFTHSIWAFNEVAESSRMIKPRQWRKYYETMKLQAKMETAEPDKLYGKRQPLFRRESGNARITVFNGSHEIVHVAALNWLAHQTRGVPAVWELDQVRQLKTNDSETESNK